jgi:hypothetical protein
MTSPEIQIPVTLCIREAFLYTPAIAPAHLCLDYTRINRVGEVAAMESRRSLFQIVTDVATNSAFSLPGDKEPHSTDILDDTPQDFSW